MGFLDWLSFAVAYLAVPGGLAAAGILFLARRGVVGMVAGTALLVAAAAFTFLLAYGFLVGVAAAGAGAAAAALVTGLGAGWTVRARVAVAAILVVLAPLAVTEGARVQADESFSRCAAGKALAAIQKSVTAGEGYPADMGEISSIDHGYGSGCYVSSGVNWLYRVYPPGSFTLGYWVDWRVSRRVCLYSSRTRSWSCGFESWGLFRPGEVD